MKKLRIRRWSATTIVIVSGLMGSFVMATDTTPASEWDVSSTGMGSSSITITPGGANAVTIGFEAQGIPPNPVICDLLVGGSDPSGMFTGDLAGKGYSGVRFKINGSGNVPESVSLVIYQSFPRYIRQWSNGGVKVSAASGEWMITLIPLERTKGWSTTFESTKLSPDQLWARDLADVHAMVLRIVPSGAAAQTYSVSDFQLTGPGVISEPAQLTPLQAYFGVSSISELTPDMLNWDSDGDGMSDYNELLAGLNPRDASSVFQARVAVSAEANTISWDGVLGGTYGVMRSNNLLEGFKLISTGIKSTFTGEVMTYADTAPVVGAANFYKVVKY